jgi:Flp pilus assembly protein TadG
MLSNVFRAQSDCLQRFVRDKAGTIAVVFALSAIPIAVAASVALDMAVASHLKSDF